MLIPRIQRDLGVIRLSRATCSPPYDVGSRYIPARANGPFYHLRKGNEGDGEWQASGRALSLYLRRRPFRLPATTQSAGGAATTGPCGSEVAADGPSTRP